MVAIPAWCEYCNQWVEMTNIFGGAGEAIGIKFTGLSVACPRCGNNARLADGEFNFRNGIIEVVSAAPWTREKLAEFQNALRWAAENYDERDPGPTVNRLATIRPEVAPFLQRMIFESWSREHVLAALTFLLAFIGFILAQCSGGDHTTFNITNVEVNNYISEYPAPVPGEDSVGPAGPPTPPLGTSEPPAPRECGPPIPPEPPERGPPL